MCGGKGEGGTGATFPHGYRDQACLEPVTSFLKETEAVVGSGSEGSTVTQSCGSAASVLSAPIKDWAQGGVFLKYSVLWEKRMAGTWRDD